MTSPGLLDAQRLGLELLKVSRKCSDLIASLCQGVDPAGPEFEKVEPAFEELDEQLSQAEDRLRR